MIKVVLIFILLLLLGQLAAAKTVINVEVQENGNALWIVEKHQPFTTQSELNEWEILLKDQGKYRYKRDIAEFSDLINKSLYLAENYSNRSMRIGNFNISYDLAKTLPSAYGITRFSFEWENFSYPLQN